MELLWLKYVADTFVIWKYSIGELQLFLHNLNNMRTSIKFTMKKERCLNYEGGNINEDKSVQKTSTYMTTATV